MSLMSDVKQQSKKHKQFLLPAKNSDCFESLSHNSPCFIKYGECKNRRAISQDSEQHKSEEAATAGLAVMEIINVMDPIENQE